MTEVALLNIGTELLRGRTVNTNASEMGKLLLAHGLLLQTTLVIHDEGPVIRDSLDQLLAKHDVVLITGGLGPTKDDITKKILLERFGGEMVLHGLTLDRIEKYMAKRERRMLETNRQQAFVPSTCEVLENDRGTAPGMVFTESGKTIISMPGVPFEMLNLMQSRVVPLLLDRYAHTYTGTRIVRTGGVPESRIAERMEEIEPDIDPRVSIAYLPSFDGTKIELRITGDPGDAAALDEVLVIAQQKVATLFYKYVYSLEDKSPDQALAEYLIKNKITMSTAESCTGGAIAASIVQHSGVSSVLKGGVVAYMREIKEKVLGVPAETIDRHGIVSRETAIAMAEGARKLMGSDFAVSITGIAEAAEDAPEDEQTQAWLGFSDANGSSALHFRLFKVREVNIQIAKNAALIYGLRCLKDR
jgi:nicotinamide-nucleotide amidase